MKIPRDALPEIVVFLGEFHEIEVEARFYKYQAPSTMQLDPLFKIGEGMSLVIEDAPSTEVMQAFRQVDQTLKFTRKCSRI